MANVDIATLNDMNQAQWILDDRIDEVIEAAGNGKVKALMTRMQEEYRGLKLKYGKEIKDLRVSLGEEV